MPTTLPLEHDMVTLHRYFKRRNLSTWDAEDMTQEVFLKLLAMGRSPDREKKAYIYTVARTLLIDKYRADTRKKLLAHVAYEEGNVTGDESLSPEIQHQENRLHTVLENKFETLTALQQKTFLEHRLEGKRLREIAADRQVTQSAVEKIIKIALTKLRSELVAYCK